MTIKGNLILLYKEAITQLEQDFNNVKTDTGRTIIADAIKTHKRELKELELEENLKIIE